MKINKLTQPSGSSGSYDYCLMLLLSLVFEKLERPNDRNNQRYSTFFVDIIIALLGLLSFIKNLIL